MHQELIEKIRKMVSTTLSDLELEGFIEEAEIKICEDSYDKNSGVYKEDLLLYYVLSQLALAEADIAAYSNYRLLYNNAAGNFHRLSFEQSPVSFGGGPAIHLW